MSHKLLSVCTDVTLWPSSPDAHMAQCIAMVTPTFTPTQSLSHPIPQLFNTEEGNTNILCAKTIIAMCKSQFPLRFPLIRS